MRRKSKKILLKLILALILTSPFFFFYLLLKSPAFLVKNIVVTTDYDITVNREIGKVLENVRGQNIFFVNEKDLGEKVKSADIKIREVDVEKQFLGKILVGIKSRQALAVVPVGVSFFLVDKEGLIFSEERETSGLPIINLSLQNIGVGSRIDEKKGGKAVLLILDSLKGKEEVISISVIEEEIQMWLQETLVLFPAEGEVDTKVNALQMVLSRFKIEGKRPTKIDLRFEKPIVTF